MVCLSDITKTALLVFDNDDAEVYFKLYLLLYAEYTVVLAESKSNQLSLPHQDDCNTRMDIK